MINSCNSAIGFACVVVYWWHSKNSSDIIDETAAFQFAYVFKTYFIKALLHFHKSIADNINVFVLLIALVHEGYLWTCEKHFHILKKYLNQLLALAEIGIDFDNALKLEGEHFEL